MKKTCVLAMFAGAAVCSVAMAAPPTPERMLGVEVSPKSIGVVTRTADGHFITKEVRPYTGSGFSTRGAAKPIIGWDGVGVPAGIGIDVAGQSPGTLCPTSCDPAGDAGGRWAYGPTSGYSMYYTTEDMQQSLSGQNIIDGMIYGWTWNPSSTDTTVVEDLSFLFFWFDDVLDSPDNISCTDVAGFTAANPDGLGGNNGLQLGYGPLAGSGSFYYFSNVGGAAGFGLQGPHGDVQGDGKLDGSYQWLGGSIQPDNTILLPSAIGSFILWGTGDVTAEANRPGTTNAFATDDDNPSDGVFDVTNECYDYTFGAGLCELNPGTKGIAFSFMRCDGDFNADGFQDGLDYDAFIGLFLLDDSDPAKLGADVNHDCFVDGLDYDTFIGNWLSSCD